MAKIASIHRVVFLALFIALATSGLVLCHAQTAASATDAPQDEIGHDIQAYLLMASGDPVGKNKVPASLENVTRLLTAFLGPNSYSLVARYIYRVKDGGSIEASGVDTYGILGPASGAKPTYYGFNFAAVNFIANKGQPIIQIRKMKFYMSVPLVYQTQNAGAKDVLETIQYKDVSITTELNLPEGMPTVVGTMSTNQPDKLLILVLMAKRSQIK